MVENYGVWEQKYILGTQATGIKVTCGLRLVHLQYI